MRELGSGFALFAANCRDMVGHWLGSTSGSPCSIRIEVRASVPQNSGENSAGKRDSQAEDLMSNPCTVCAHRQRNRIDRALASSHSLRRVAAKYGLTKSAIHRHAHHPADPELRRLLNSKLVLSDGPRPVRGNPDKTKPYRWKRGQSGNPRGRPSGSSPKSAFTALLKRL